MAEPGDHFPTTAWTAVEQAAEDGKALSGLLERYWQPLWVHLVKTKRLSESEADDVLQEFLTSRVLERNLLARAERGRGKFRWFLCTSINNFLADRRRAQASRKAAPDRAQGIDAENNLASPDEDVGVAFEAGWALTILSKTVRRMEAECRAAGRPDLWAAFQARAGRIMQGQEPVSYAVLAKEIGARDEKQAANIWATALAKFQRILQQVLAEFGAEDSREELGDLKAAITACGPELLETLRVQLWSEHPAMSVETNEGKPLNVDAVVDLWARDDEAGISCQERWTALLETAVAADSPDATIRSVLADPSSPVALLERIKDYAKDLRGGAREEPAAEVATVLYYLAIAVGLVRAKQLITDQDKGAVQRGFAWAEGRPWIDEQARAWLVSAKEVSA